MTRVLLTAFEPYDRWKENASWLALVDLTCWFAGTMEVTTRRYPVDLAEMSQRLQQDLRENYDIALHLGQAPGSPVIELESVGLNVRSDGTALIEGAPEAYRSKLQLDAAAAQLNEAGIPTIVSHHAGTYLCNAALYLSQHYASALEMRTRSAFVHVPLTPAQVARDGQKLASLSTPMASAAIAIMLQVFDQST